MSDQGVKPCPGCGTQDSGEDEDGPYWIHDKGCPMPMCEGEIATVAAACGIQRAEIHALLRELQERIQRRTPLACLIDKYSPPNPKPEGQ
jgi:hypothetical protein